MSLFIYYDFLMSVLESHPELHRTAKGAFKQVAWTVAGTVIGGVVRGPLGAMVGSIVGVLIGYVMSDNYKSLVRVMLELNDTEKAQLVGQVQHLVGSTSEEALVEFLKVKENRVALIQVLKAIAASHNKSS